MKFKKLESGRSMVEMLGVLAIIGVLSVGGIAGYSLSMRRYRANQVVDLMSKYAVMVYGHYLQKISNGDMDSYEYFEPTDAPSFEDFSLGNLPAGVIEFDVGSLSISSTTPTDEVRITTYFSDEKLCKAVGSTVGETCYSNNKDWYIHASIKQN